MPRRRTDRLNTLIPASIPRGECGRPHHRSTSRTAGDVPSPRPKAGKAPMQALLGERRQLDQPLQQGSEAWWCEPQDDPPSSARAGRLMAAPCCLTRSRPIPGDSIAPGWRPSGLDAEAARRHSGRVRRPKPRTDQPAKTRAIGAIPTRNCRTRNGMADQAPEPRPHQGD